MNARLREQDTRNQANRSASDDHDRDGEWDGSRISHSERMKNIA